jgi:hypothetical protein
MQKRFYVLCYYDFLILKSEWVTMVKDIDLRWSRTKLVRDQLLSPFMIAKIPIFTHMLKDHCRYE